MKKTLLFRLVLAILVFGFAMQNANAQCAAGQSEITFTLDLSSDAFPDEAGWRLVNTTDGVTVDSACFGVYAGNAAVNIITLCVDTGKNFVFYAMDDFGDGLDGGTYNLAYTFGTQIGLMGANNFNVPVTHCGAAYTNNEIADSLAFTSVYFAAPNCLPPTALLADSIATDSAFLNWTENNTSTSWEIEWGLSGFAIGSGMRVVTANNPYVLTGLMPATNYDWYVRSICGSMDTSIWSVRNTFKTAIQGPLGVNCASGSPASAFNDDLETQGGWTGDFGTTNRSWRVNSGGTTSGSTGPTGSQSGNNYFYFESSTNGADTTGAIVSPMIDLTGASSEAELSFWMHAYGASIGTLDVGVSTSASGPFTSVFTWSGQLQSTNADPFVNVGVNLNTYVGQIIYLQFDYVHPSQTAFNGDLAIDLVSVNTCLSCPAPVSLASSNVTGTTADLAWVEQGSATTWEIEYDTANFTPGTGNRMIVTANPFTLTGISPETSYDWYVRAVCGSMDTSAWTGPNSFLTGCLNFTAPFNETFENNSTSLGCWRLSGPEPWVLATTGGHVGNAGTILGTTISGGNFIYVDDSQNSTGIGVTAETPFIDVSALTTPRVRFHTISDNEGFTNVDFHMDVYDGANWTDSVYFSNTNTTNGGWEEIIVDLSGFTFTGPMKVRFVVDEVNGTDFYDDRAIDDVSIEDTPDPYYPIGVINKDDANGEPDSLGVFCWTSGTVFGVDLDGNNGLSFYILDQSSGSSEGINVFNFNDVSNYVVNEGDSIMIHGEVDFFNGLTELFVDSIEVIASNAFLPAPNLVTVLDASTEAQLIRMTNLSVTAASSATGSSVNYTVTDGTNISTIRVDGDTDVHDSVRWVVGDTICSIIGIGGQFDNSTPYTSGYQIFPMRFTDIDTCVTTSIAAQTIESGYSISPNPSEGLFNLRSSGFESEVVRIQTMDINGRIVFETNINNAQSAQLKQIDLSDLAKGIYFLKIQDGQKQIIEKLIVR